MRNINLRYVDEAYDENGLLTRFDITMPDNFNFAYDVVDDIAINDPERTAMVWCNPEGEEHVFTFADMKTWSDKTANFLADCGIGRGDFVMVILRRHYQFWFTMLALEKLGAVAVPATFMLKEHDLTYRLNGADIKAIIATSAGDIADTIDAVVEDVPQRGDAHPREPCRRRAHPSRRERELGRSRRRACRRGALGPCWHLRGPRRARGLARLQQRGARRLGRLHPPRDGGRRSHAHVLLLGHFGQSQDGAPRFRLRAGAPHHGQALAQREPQGAALHHRRHRLGQGGIWGKFFGPGSMEAAVLTYDFDRYDPAEILSLVGRYGVTTLCCPPTMYRLMTEVDVDAFDLSSLEYCTTAGEALNPDLFDFWREHTGLTIYEGFGQTETPLTVGNLTNSTPRPGSMGKPVPMYVMKVLREDGTECDTGETGEICIAIDPHPAGIMMEYYRNPEKTAEAMHDGWYHTGDTAWRDEEGNYWYVGRNDDVIKSSGYRIGPFEIESVMLEHDAVREVAVTGVPDPVRGFAVKATVVLADGWQGSDELTAELQKWVKRQTAPYKYPRIIEYVDELPRTVNGKIRRAAIREQDKTHHASQKTPEGLI